MTIKFLRDVGDRIKTRRKQRGMSLDELARSIERSKTGLWQVERGRSEPGACTLSRLAIALSCSVDYLLFGDKDRNADALQRVRCLLVEVQRLLP